ncbi:MAG: hypothetical protein ABR499_04555 [Gemmatimonadaceae bacterium]
MRRCVLALLGASILPLALPRAACGQQVTGRVVRPRGDQPQPVAGAWVVLHRIGHDSAGPLDSTRTDARGTYAFRYSRSEEDSALFLVSSVYGGVAYFTPPLRAGNIRGEAAEIMVFDTTSARLPLRVQGRHLVVATGSEGSSHHDVLEVYELSNDTSLTAVAPKSGSVWTALVPEGARQFRIGEGDVSEGGLVMRNGRVELFAPIAPGLKQISFRYQLPRDAFPLTVPITESVGVLEVVSDDPGARVSGAGLREVRAMTSEGRTFKRFLAQDVPRNAVVRIALAGGGGARGATVALLGALFTAAAGGALALAIRRARSRPARRPSAARPAAAPESDVLIRAIAELDARFESAPGDGDRARAAYEAERRDLKERLRAALARSPRPA